MKLRLINTALTLFIAALLLTGIILAKNVLIPFVVSIFLMYLLYPVAWQLEKRGFNRALAILTVIIIFVIIIGGIGIFATIHFSNKTIDITELQDMVSSKLDTVKDFLDSRLGIDVSSTDKYLKQASDKIFTSWESAIASLFSATTTIIFQLAILPVFTFFLLYYRTKAAYFILRLTNRKYRFRALLIMSEISSIAVRYVAGVFTVVFILAILNSIGLTIIGIPHAILLGVLAAILNLIPYIGTFLGGLIPVLFVMFTYDNPIKTVFQIVIMFIIVQFIENNLLTPNIVGNNVKINPLAIILSLLIANIIWGVAGMLIVVPCLAIAKVIMRNIDELKPFAYLISDRGMEKYKIKFNFLKKIINKIKMKLNIS